MRRRVNRLVFLACSCVLVATGSALAQAPDSPETRVVPVSVIDRDGKAVVGLTAANFRGEFRGQPVSIKDVSGQDGEHRVVVLLDVSAGVRDNPRAWELAWTAANDLLDNLDSSHKISVVTFSDRALYRGTFAAGPEENVSNPLRSLEAEAQTQGGSTSLFDALLAAVEMKVAGSSPDILYVLSDGVDNTSANDAEAVERKLAASGSRPFFFILPPPLGDDPFLFRRGRRQVRGIAEGCGGLVIDFSRTHYNQGDLFAATRPAYDSMIRPYVITVELPQPVDKPRKWKLEVVDERGKKLKNIEVAYPRLLVPLSAAAANK